MKSKKRLAAFALLAVAFALLAAGCSKDVNTDADTLACVYDGSSHGGHRLLQEVQPGDHISTDSANIVVKIPTSNRFWNSEEAAPGQKDNPSRDTLAPEHYLAYAKDHVPVFVQGQIRFRFNTSGNLACDWYAHHGRRNALSNGDLQFNVRGRSAQAQSGWFRFLSENFSTVMSQVAKDDSANWTWQQLVYGSDTSVKYTGSDPVDVAYGRQIGAEFQKRLNGVLGGDYFCGTDPAITGAGDKGCAPIYFQVGGTNGGIRTTDPKLMTQHQQVTLLAQQLQTDQQEAQLREEHRANQIADAKAERKVLIARLENARLDALIASQKCIVLAEHGLDCDGHKQTIIIGGGVTTPTK